MDDVVEISGLENACRLCLTTEQTRSSIFGVPHVTVPFVDKIRAYLSIDVSSEDKVSTLVCVTCIKNINHWHSYRDTCLRSQEKLQLWLARKNAVIQPTIKEEPMDTELADNAHMVASHENVHLLLQNVETSLTEHPETIIHTRAVPALEPIHRPNDRYGNNLIPMVQIKNEPLDTEDEDDCNVDVESVNSGELLLNPMAVAAGNTSNENAVEADSTQKFATKQATSKKKIRRGPHTHFRGARLFKKKCPNCKIYLHSKYSYQQHMSRYHGIVSKDEVSNQQPPPARKQRSKLTQNVPEMELLPEIPSRPEEAVFEEMIQTDPLTQVQKTIIGQLKTFSCYSCKQTFFDRRHTLNHVRQHMPDLRPYTCIACLTEFSDRSMYKLHCGASFECAMKIALVIPSVGEEKYFTCNMCLRPLSHRMELLEHLAQHADRQHKQLNQPLRAPPNLKPINPPVLSPRNLVTSSPAKSAVPSSPSKQSMTPLSGPYMNGDPAYNFMCDLCGMIYRYRPNMFKHRELCLTLPASIRTSYRCIHCNMTYLVYKKFYTHVFSEHKKREIICYTCKEKFPSADDYLTHHETHRNIPIQAMESSFTMDVDPLNSSQHPTDVGEKPFNCTLCGEDFATNAELAEHRNLHLKVKIYSCVICRSMFSSSGALESHMKEHGIDEVEQKANSSYIEYGDGSGINDSLQSEADAKFFCRECGKGFANVANVRRHEKNVHNSQKGKQRWVCDKCKRWFKSTEDYQEHMSQEHGIFQQHQLFLQQPQQQQVPQLPVHQLQQPQSSPVSSRISATTGKPLMQCPKCPKMFAYQGNLIQHCQTVHKEDPYERVMAASRPPPALIPAPRHINKPINKSLSHSCDICGKSFREEQSLKVHRGWHLRSTYKLKNELNSSVDDRLLAGNYSKSPGFAVPSQPKPAKARKSFPNNPSQKQMNLVATLQCQVCDDKFFDVAELRKHLWDVHCAKNKPEKKFHSDLQCELCTHRFPDEEALQAHMKWHSQNPIFSHNSSVSNSDVDKIESAEVNPNKPFYCEICGKYYSNRKVFQRHKKLHKVLPVTAMMNLHSLQTRRHYCHTCQKNFSTEASLKRHKASQGHASVVRSQLHVPPKKITTTALIHQPPPETQSIKDEPDLEQAQAVKKKSYTCSDCKTPFPNMSVLYQHRQLVHKAGSPTKEKSRSVPASPADCVPLMSSEGLVCCNICGKQFPGISNLKQHFAHKHRARQETFPCPAPNCKLVFHTASSLKNHETTHTSTIYSCRMCEKHVYSKAAINKHMLVDHKAVYQPGTNKNNLWNEIDLSNYNIKNLQGTSCPKCKIKYPNLRALKIHYFKFHDKS